MKILFSSSHPQDWFEIQDSEDHFRRDRASICAIGYHLEKIGWTVAWAGRKTTVNPFKLAKRIDGFKPDIVYSYGAVPSLNPLFARRLLCKHRKFIVVHGWDDAYGDIWANEIGWIGRITMNWLEKRIVKNSDAVVTLSRYLQNRGKSWGINCHFIPNGADRIDDCGLHGSIRLKGRFNIVYSGDKAKWKRTADICESMRHVSNDIKLYLTGRDYDYLNQYKSDNCIFLGFLPKEEQLHVMRQADAFVVTADQDCNAKLQEYLRWNKPILAFDGRPNLFFANGRNALLAKDGDYAPLIERLAADPALCQALADNAAHDIPVYTWAEIASQFDSYFRSLS